MWKQKGNQTEKKEAPEKTEEEKRLENERSVYEWMQAVISSVLGVVLLFTFCLRLMGVDGHSMLPTLQDRDRLLVLNTPLYQDFQYGDIVILRKQTFTQEPIVKRIIATEGQTVDIDFTTGSVWVDGVLLDEPYIAELTFTQEGLDFPMQVPEGSIFVMGDNRNGSNDSRDVRLGTVDTRYVIGKAVFLVVPGPDVYTEEPDFNRIGPIHGTDTLDVGLTRLQREWA